MRCNKLEAIWTKQDLENYKNFEIKKKYTYYLEKAKKAKIAYLSTLEKIKSGKLSEENLKTAFVLLNIEKQDCWEYFNKSEYLKNLYPQIIK